MGGRQAFKGLLVTHDVSIDIFQEFYKHTCVKGFM
jgi:hypothetical protein